MEKIKLDRVISIATLLAAVVAIVLALKKPAPVAQLPQASQVAASTQPSSVQSYNPQQFSQKPDPFVSPTQSTQTTQPSQITASNTAISQPGMGSSAGQSSKPAANINSAAVSAAVSQLLGNSAGGAAPLSPDSEVGAGTPNIKDQKVDVEGDTVHGQFLTEIAGKDVWVTIAGHMGQKDGYATFDPTEFKVGDVEVPVALVNPALQRKLAEERDRLKVADPAAGAK
jgi:hypothetical protein